MLLLADCSMLIPGGRTTILHTRVIFGTGKRSSTKPYHVDRIHCKKYTDTSLKQSSITWFKANPRQHECEWNDDKSVALPICLNLASCWTLATSKILFMVVSTNYVVVVAVGFNHPLRGMKFMLVSIWCHWHAHYAGVLSNGGAVTVRRC